eukprot:495505_1
MYNNEITKSYLHNIHQQQLSNGLNNENNTLKIVHALGGVDNLLNTILVNDAIQLTQHELYGVHQIITDNSDNHPHETKKHKSINNSKIHKTYDMYNQKENRFKVVWKFQKENNCIALWFGQTHSVFNVIHSNIAKVMLAIVVIIHMILYYSAIDTQIWCIYTIVSTPIFIIYGICFGLSVNKLIFQKITKTTDFWIQLIYYTIFQLNDFWYRIDKNIVGSQYTVLYLMAMIFMSIFSWIGIAVVVSFDGHFGINRIWKIVSTGLLGFVFIFSSLYWQFLSYTKGDDSIIHIYGNIAFSRINQMTNAFQIIGIFFTKQCILTYCCKNRAAVMVARPYVIWNEQQKEGKNINEFVKRIENDNDNPTEIQIAQNTIRPFSPKHNEDEDSVSTTVISSPKNHIPVHYITEN